MLVLSRQRDETIMIGDDVEITIVDIRGDKVRLGITAPRHIQVHRKEVYDAIKRENEQAAKMRPKDMTDAMERESDARKRKESDQSEHQNKPERKDGGSERANDVRRLKG
ncbi:MAG: carbon storage regulator CsrA [Planctomycetes bacterium]|nr:carbon storage regulator CsrA [Planctomycetota bacterium]